MKLAQVGEGKPVIAADAQDAVDIAITDTGYAKQRLARRGVDVNGKEFAVRLCPSELWDLV